jgi:hypothetical protein
MDSRVIHSRSSSSRWLGCWSPEDDTEENQERREVAASESGTPISELDESDLIACADDEFWCSEALTLWAVIRKARALIGETYPA